MQYWKDLNSGKVFGYDVSDPAQVAAMNERLAIGVWEDVTKNWPPPPPLPTKNDNKHKAVLLLQQTDWVNQPDVCDPTNNPCLLNKQEFLTYRQWLRNIAINPPAGVLAWPTLPNANWTEVN